MRERALADASSRSVTTLRDLVGKIYELRIKIFKVVKLNIKYLLNMLHFIYEWTLAYCAIDCMASFIVAWDACKYGGLAASVARTLPR